MAKPLTREDLDRMLIESGDRQLRIACGRCPASTHNVIFRDGFLRLLCGGCGFEVVQVSVALGRGGEGQ